MPSKSHVHRYVRAVGRLTKENKDSGFIGYYKCADPGCPHYMKTELILGKKSICNRCFKEFILPLSIRGLTNRPHCKDCTRGSKDTNPKVDISKVLKAKSNQASIEEFLDLVEEEG